MSTVVLVATPLPDDLVERVRSALPDVEVLYDASLLAPPRYPSDHAGDPAWRPTPEREERLAAWRRRAEVMLGVPGASVSSLGEVVRESPRLRWVQGTAAGTGQQVRAAGLTREDLRRVTITSSVGVHAGQLAEFALLGLLAFTKDLRRLDRDREAHAWDHYPMRELRGQRLLVVGLGHIGREVARLARAHGMVTTGMRRHPLEPDGELVDRMRPTSELVQAAGEADAVVLALPATDATEGLFGAAAVGALPRHAIVVNVGRGSTLDEDALVAALRRRELAGAALDVTRTEPLPDDSPLWSLDNVLLSPHTAALSTGEDARIVELFIDNLQRFRRGQPLRNQIDPEGFY